jgi:uracil-DNA glycosylase
MVRTKNLSTSLATVAVEAAHCERCPLYLNATQTVFGEGPADAALMLVGEQPGDQEDLQGRPFVGPAGKILDRALGAIGLDRGTVYITNAVKHFKNEPRGKRRLHKRPNQYEVEQCRWWLDLELKLVQPSLVVALGVTAAYALAQRAIILNRERGRLLTFPGEIRGMATIHPSSILRMPDKEKRDAAFESFVADLHTATELVRPKWSARVGCEIMSPTTEHPT